MLLLEEADAATMHRITIYRHPECARCERIARWHHRFDWLKRVRSSIEIPPTGPLKMGEIVVEKANSGEILRGIDAVRTIVRQIPAYWLALPALRIPSIASKIDQDVRGCDGESCSI